MIFFSSLSFFQFSVKTKRESVFRLRITIEVRFSLRASSLVRARGKFCTSKSARSVSQLRV